MEYLPPFQTIRDVSPSVQLHITLDWLLVVQKYEKGYVAEAKNQAMIRDVVIDTFQSGATVAYRELLGFARMLEKKYEKAFVAMMQNFPLPNDVVRKLWNAPEE
jgi:cobalamin biosynthesis Co2+ chelatase CbiK